MTYTKCSSTNGEAVELTAGGALRIDPHSVRQIGNGDTESQFVLVGAP
ncbi:hypothetical protein [Halomicroarcula marina]|nr:hypothetical protein [Halomicroarcula marina]